MMDTLDFDCCITDELLNNCPYMKIVEPMTQSKYNAVALKNAKYNPKNTLIS